MNFSKIFFPLLLIGLSLCFQKIVAQSLNGKVIHVSPSQVVMIKFRSVINNFNFTSKEATSLFQTRIINNKNFSINSTVGNFKSTNLIIIEGDNTHLFILDYKESLDPNESVYDFSKKKTLSDEAALLSSNVKKAIDSAKVAKDSAVPLVKPLEKSVPSPKETDEKYSDVITQANKAYSAKKYDEAKDLYNSALLLKPKDAWSLSQLTDIENRKHNIQKEDQQKLSELTYQNHKRVGDSAFNKKSYEVARFEYNQALKEKANDSYSLSQLKKIDQALKNDSYNSFMNIGKDAVANQLFDNATMAFNEALKIRPNDPDATKELAKLNSAKTASAKKKNDDNAIIEQQNKYTDTLALADNMFQAGMYDEARKKYKKAESMKPGAAYHKKQLAAIDSILLKRKSDLSKIKQDSSNGIAYNNQISQGNKAMDGKDLKKAKGFFEIAQKMKPNEKYPVEKISEIDILMARAEEDKKKDAASKAEKENTDKQYNFLIKRGNTSLSANDLNVAKDCFTKASELKPAEKFPKDQLDLINRKLQEIRNNERYEKFIHLGDSMAFTIKDYKTSLQWYDSATALKPSETYPRKRIIIINQMMLKRDSLLMEAEGSKERNLKYNEIADLYKRADAARLERRYQDSYKLYDAFLGKIDMTSFDKYTSTQQYSIKQAREMLGRLQTYKPDLVADSIRNAHIQDSLNNVNKNTGKRKKKKG